LTDGSGFGTFVLFYGPGPFPSLPVAGRSRAVRSDRDGVREVLQAFGGGGMIWAGIAGETLSNRETTRLGTGLFRLDARDVTPTWRDVHEGLGQEPEVRTIALHPKQPGALFVGTQHGVHRSDDGGGHWRELDLPVPYYGVWALALHPLDPDVMLAGYEPGAVYRSEDGGRTWGRAELVASYPPLSAADPKRVMSLAFDPERPDLVFGAVEVGGLLRSLDGGRSWHSVDCLGGERVCSRCRKAFMRAGRIHFGRSVVATESAAKGRRVRNPASKQRGRAEMRTCTHLAAPSEEHATVDRADVHAVAVSGGRAFAATRVGVLRSDDGGDSWQHVAGDWIDVAGVAHGAVQSAVDGLSRARFGGNLRVLRCEAQADGLRLELTVHFPGRDDYGGGFDPRGIGGRRDAEGRMCGAACWHAHAAVIEQLLACGGRVRTVLAQFESLAHFRSFAGDLANVPCQCNVEGAEEDLAFQSGVRRWLMADQYCRSLAVAPDDARTVYVGAGRGYLSPTGTVWCTRDGGDSWCALDLPSAIASGVFALATHPAAPDDLYAAAKDGQLFVSRDRGRVWREVAMPAAASPVYALGVAPEGP
jgi:photosystem II stability/assembly factor-like uncharacterized protein